jgi:hypothetical protein
MRYLGWCLIVLGIMFALLELVWLAMAGARGVAIVLGVVIAIVIATPLVMVGGYLVQRRG